MEPLNFNRVDPERGQIAAFRGHALLLTDQNGEMTEQTDGFFFRRTRFLSRMRLLVNGAEPEPICAATGQAHSLLVYRLVRLAGEPPGGEIARKAIVIETNVYVGDGMHLDMRVSNHALDPATIALTWDCAADYADQQEANSGKREQNAPVECAWSRDGDTAELTFRYAHPELHHGTVLRFSGAEGFVHTDAHVHCMLTLRPRECRSLTIAVAPVFNDETIEPIYGIDGVNGEPSPPGIVELETSSHIVQAAWNRAVADLASLPLHAGEGEEQMTLAAGVPNYLGLFGRDSLVAALQAWLLHASTLRGTLRTLQRWIAHDYDDSFDAQPGKLLHQRLLGPLALLNKNPYLHYYGDYSAPALFLLGIAWDLAQTGDLEFFRSFRKDALRVLEWMDRDGDHDGDGFYEYQTRAGKRGLKNQGWKDSGEAILYPDGSIVQDPIAVCEVQGLYYGAKQAIGLAFAQAGDDALAHKLLSEAAALKRRFNERFWMPEERYFALALGPDKEQIRSIASNAGECLIYGIIDDDKAGAVIERLLKPDMFSGWGIRTLSSEHPAYNPFGYHIGAVWPSASSVVARGCQRYGAIEALHRIAEGVFAASRLFTADRLPEVFGGMPRDERHPHPGLYPGACSPQAWSAAAVVSLIDAMLGLTPLAPLRTLIVDPHLPAWLPALTLRDIRVGDARVSLRFQRGEAGETDFEVIGRSGTLDVFRPPHPRGAGIGDRLSRSVRAAAREKGAPVPARVNG